METERNPKNLMTLQHQLLNGGLVLLVAMTILGLGRDASADADNIIINCATNRLDGNIAGYGCDIYVESDTFTGGKVVNTATNEVWPLLARPDGSIGVTLMYATLAEFETSHPNPSSYHFYFNETAPNTYEDQILLGYAVLAPSDYAHITYPLHGATDVPSNPVYAWDNIEGLGWMYGTQVRDIGTQTVYADMPDFTLDEATWQPGALDQAEYYEFLTRIFNVTTGEGLWVQTLNGEQVAYYGLREESNQVNFITAPPSDIPEPMTMLLVGTGAVGMAGFRRRRRMK